MFAVVITVKGIMMMKFRYYQSIPSSILNFYKIPFFTVALLDPQ